MPTSDLVAEMQQFGQEVRHSITRWKEIEISKLSGQKHILEMTEIADVILASLDTFLSSGAWDQKWPIIVMTFAKADFARDCLGQANVAFAQIGSREFIEPFCVKPTFSIEDAVSPECRKSLDAYRVLGRFLLNFSIEVFRQTETLRKS